MMNLPKTSKIDKKATRFIISPDGAAGDAMQCGRDPVAPTPVARRYGPADQNSRLGRAGNGRIHGPPSLGFAKETVSRIVSGLRAGNYRPCFARPFAKLDFCAIVLPAGPAAAPCAHPRGRVRAEKGAG